MFQDWEHEWLYANFGHLLSVMLLGVLMWLWQPVDTWQSYAFQPLGGDISDGHDDFDDEEIVMDADKMALGKKICVMFC